MRRWYVPLTVLGLGSLGLLFVSERGQQAMRWLLDAIEDAPDTLAGWEYSAELELARIESALNEIEAQLGVR